MTDSDPMFHTLRKILFTQNKNLIGQRMTAFKGINYTFLE